MRYTVVFIGFLGQILLQFALQLILAKLYGTSSQMDAYLAAMTLPVAVSAIVAGTVSPLIVTAIHQSGREANEGSPVRLLTLVPCLIAIVVAICSAMFPEFLMSALHPGFDQNKVATTAALFRILVWLIPANTAIGLGQALLNGSLIFTVPAIAGVLGPLLTVAMIPFLEPSLGIKAVAWATLSGAILNVVIQWPAVWSRLPAGFLFPGWRPLQRLAPLGIPILIGMLLVRIDPLVDRYVSSELDDGSIAKLGHAYRIVTIFVMLASGTLSTVSFPQISQGLAQGRDAVVQQISIALRTLLTLVIPSMAVLICFSKPLVRDLLERGEFTASDTAAVAMLLQFYAVYLIGVALGELLGKACYVLNDSRTPTIIGGFWLLIGVALKLWLVPTEGISWLAGISSAYAAGTGISLIVLIAVKVGTGVFEGIGRHFFFCLLATTCAGGTGLLFLQLEFPFCAIAGLTVGAVVYFGVLASLDSRSREQLLRVLKRWSRNERETDLSENDGIS